MPPSASRRRSLGVVARESLAQGAAVAAEACSSAPTCACQRDAQDVTQSSLRSDAHVQSGRRATQSYV